MGKILIKIYISILVIASSLCSCSTDGCTENQSSIPLVGFYSIETGDAIALNQLNVYGIGATGDSLLTDGATPTQQVYLPLRSTQNNTAFCFHYTEFGELSTAYNDTIWVEYKSTPYFASEECGAMFRYKITSLRHTNILIDSIYIIDSEITNIDVERIKIFFKTN